MSANHLQYFVDWGIKPFAVVCLSYIGAYTVSQAIIHYVRRVE